MADAALPVCVAADHIYNVVGDEFPSRTTFIIADKFEKLYREKQHTPFCLWHAFNAIAARPGSLVSLALARCVYHLDAVKSTDDHIAFVESWRRRKLDEIANPELNIPLPLLDEVDGETLVCTDNIVPRKLIHPHGFSPSHLVSLLDCHGVACKVFSERSKRSLISNSPRDFDDCASWLNFSASPVAGLILHKGWHYTALRLVRNQNGTNEWHHIDSVYQRGDVGSPDPSHVVSRAEFNDLILGESVWHVIVVPSFDSKAVFNSLTSRYSTDVARLESIRLSSTQKAASKTSNHHSFFNQYKFSSSVSSIGKPVPVFCVAAKSASVDLCGDSDFDLSEALVCFASVYLQSVLVFLFVF